ncbi:hypothetical protein [Streptomyces sp. WELS2]|nr:hypothetical protein [Streptomyces sp. WELS2]
MWSRTLRGDASSIKNHVLPYWAEWEMRVTTRLDVQSWPQPDREGLA